MKWDFVAVGRPMTSNDDDDDDDDEQLLKMRKCCANLEFCCHCSRNVRDKDANINSGELVVRS